MYFKEYLNQVGKVKNFDTNKVLNDSSKGVMTGAAIGGGIGLMVGFGRKKNLLLSAFIGSIVGGIVSKVFINKK